MFASEAGKQILGENSNSCGVDGETTNRHENATNRKKAKIIHDYRKVLQMMFRTLNVKFYLSNYTGNPNFRTFEGNEIGLKVPKIENKITVWKAREGKRLLVRVTARFQKPRVGEVEIHSRLNFSAHFNSNF